MLTLHYNHPTKTKKQQILKALKKRMSLPADNLKTLHRLEKGYEGEARFWKLMKAYLTSDCIVLYDLLHESNETKFQLDCTIIQQREIWHLEIKNFEGDFQLKDNALYSLNTKKEVKSPLNQLERSKFLFNQLLENNSHHFPINSHIIFVHPEFAIYQHQPNQLIVHPAQMIRFIKMLNSKPSKLSSYHYKLAHKLFSTQHQEDPYKRLPPYKMSQMNKGIYCLNCAELLVAQGNRVKCESCHYHESKQSAVMRSVLEFNLLFPRHKMTTNIIWKWCGGVYSRYQLRKILYRYLKPVGSTNGVHFQFLE